MNREKTVQVNEQLKINYAERDTFINFLINLQERIEKLEKEISELKNNITVQPTEIMNTIANGLRKINPKS